MNPQRGYCSIVRQIVQPVGNGACYSAVAILAVPHEWVSAEPPARLTPGANLKHRHIEQVPIRFLSLLIHRKLVAQQCGSVAGGRARPNADRSGIPPSTAPASFRS